MSAVIPNPNAPKQSSDYIYGKRLEKYEDRMNFFLNEKVDIDKTNVKDIDGKSVDGLEGIIQRFTTYGASTLPEVDDNGYIAGTEASGKAKTIIDFLIQAAKDAVDFLLNLVNNRLARIDNRVFRLSIDRKRSGLKDGEVKFPVSIRRLIVPQLVGPDPNWVPQALDKVIDFYKSTVKAYSSLSSNIGKWDSGKGTLYEEISSTIEKAATVMGMRSIDYDYQSRVLPGVRQLNIGEPARSDPSKIDIFFASVDVPVKLSSPTFVPTSNLIDSTIKKVNDAIKTIRSEQSTMSQLTRNFEKAVRKYENEKTTKLTPDEREYYNWLIRFNKRLMNVTLQYIMNELDAGIDFINAGVSK